MNLRFSSRRSRRPLRAHVHLLSRALHLQKIDTIRTTRRVQAHFPPQPSTPNHAPQVQSQPETPLTVRHRSKWNGSSQSRSNRRTLTTHEHEAEIRREPRTDRLWTVRNTTSTGNWHYPLHNNKKKNERKNSKFHQITWRWRQEGHEKRKVGMRRRNRRRHVLLRCEDMMFRGEGRKEGNWARREQEEIPKRAAENSSFRLLLFLLLHHHLALLLARQWAQREPESKRERLESLCFVGIWIEKLLVY